MGEKFSEKEYNDKIKNIDLGSYKEYLYWKEKAQEYFKKNIPQPVWETQSNNVSGSYVFRSKNCKECYDVTGCEDSKYLMLVRDGSTKDSYDYVDWGMNAELIYECVTVGESPFNVKFSHESGWGLNDAEYCKSVVGGSDIFGCISIRNKKYCILNKQYTKEEYEAIVPKIIEQMQRNGERGEFFPSSISPFGYNETIAQEYFPYTREKALSQ